MYVYMVLLIYSILIVATLASRAAQPHALIISCNPPPPQPAPKPSLHVKHCNEKGYNIVVKMVTIGIKSSWLHT